MALKPDRDYNVVTDIVHKWSEVSAQNTQEKGGVASVESAGSGVGQDQDEQVARYDVEATSSSIALGVLLQDVNPELSAERDFLNLHTLEVRPGDPVTLVRKGWVVTNSISGTPSAGDAAFLANDGLVSPTQVASAPQVGRFETTQDSDGFARVYMDI